MQFCSNCGLLLPPGAAACPKCGQPAPAPKAAEPQSAARYTQPAPGAGADADANKELTTGGYLLTLIVFLVPLVGFIMMLVWSFGGTMNTARKKLAQAYLIRTLAVAVLVAILFLVVALVTATVVSGAAYPQTPPPQVYTW